MLLNLGHTVGHGLEAASDYRGIRHGEGVALGMIAAMRVAQSLGRGRAQETERLTRLLDRLGLPTNLDERLNRRTLDFIGSDKKRRGDDIHFVFPGLPWRDRDRARATRARSRSSRSVLSLGNWRVRRALDTMKTPFGGDL